MGEIELALGGIFEAGPLAEKLGDAKNGGERIVELVGHAGEHLAHGRQFLRLDELFFQTFQLGDVAAGDDHAVDLAGFVEQWTEMTTDAGPFAELVAPANLQGRERPAAGGDFRKERLQRGAVFRMGALVKLLLVVLFGVVAKNVFNARAGESAVARGVEDENQIREAVHQTARKFLLLIQTAFHFAPFGDVHQRAVITNDVAAGIADHRGGVQTNERAAVFAGQSDLAPLKLGLALDFQTQEAALLGVRQDVGECTGQKVFLGIVSEHANERGIGVDDAIVRSNDIDAFLKGLEQFGETRFVFAKSGDIAGEHGDAVHLVIAEHGMRDTVEITSAIPVFEANFCDSGPVAALQESRHGAAYEALGGARVFDKIAQRPADDLRE